MRKKIVVYYHKLLLGHDPFLLFGDKRSVYHLLFQKGLERGHEMYLASGKENQASTFSFTNTYLYNGTSFEPHDGPVIADAIYDRSGGVTFPSLEASARTLNGREFKLLCHDKYAMQKLLGPFMPQSVLIQNQAELHTSLQNFPQDTRVVLKPTQGMCGKGIHIDFPAHINTLTLEPETHYVLQEFVDTSKGIPGLISGNHDLRIIIVDGQITLAHARSPKKGSLLANVSQGGSIKEVPLENIPHFVKEMAKKVQTIIDTTFDFPLYSIDFGIQNENTPFVFELNDQIGFPRESMLEHPVFVERILDSLEKKASQEAIVATACSAPVSQIFS